MKYYIKLIYNKDKKLHCYVMKIDYSAKNLRDMWTPNGSIALKSNLKEIRKIRHIVKYSCNPEFTPFIRHKKLK